MGKTYHSSAEAFGMFTVSEESYKTCIDSTSQGLGIVNLVEEFMHHICLNVHACACL